MTQKQLKKKLEQVKKAIEQINKTLQEEVSTEVKKYNDICKETIKKIEADPVKK